MTEEQKQAIAEIEKIMQEHNLHIAVNMDLRPSTALGQLVFIPKVEVAITPKQP